MNTSLQLNLVDETKVSPQKPETVKRPRHILSLSTEEKRRFIDSFDHVFSDVDGVVWNVQSTVEGAAEGYRALQDAGKRRTFITNNSVRPEHSYVQRFKALNINMNVDDLIHPAKTTVQYLKSINFEGLIYIIATDVYKDVLRKAGYKLLDGPNIIIDESFTELTRHVFVPEPVRAVIIDVDFNLSGIKMVRANYFLRDPECLLIAGATDMLLPLGNDMSILGPGSFAKIIAEVSNRPLIALGKPGPELAKRLIAEFKIEEPRRNLMIGDMLVQDVGFGKECGFQTLVVLSGLCSREELEAVTDPNLTPDYYADSVADFAVLMRDLKKSNV